MRAQLILVALVALTAGCAKRAGDGYPSLLPRAIESADTAEPMREPVPAAPDPALDQQVTALAARLDEASRVFAAQADRAAQLAAEAQGADAGSEPWLAAQVALGELDVLRAATSGLVADIERSIIDRAAAGAMPYPALQSLYEDATRRAAAERARVTEVEAMLATA
ncbi:MULTISPECIES: hypothetical protein [unclassified Sphingomonas]|uniref:hypothetical protein n=1 Tax=unclassified Sphingomonas TaxID=196159 RepID=UPI00083262BD|nr:MULTISPECIES: hypothetical protein [unclassified Sphingomonas]